MNFKAGDRVIVTGYTDANGDCAPPPDTDLGQIGTVLEDSDCPWILFDEDTRWHTADHGGLGEMCAALGLKHRPFGCDAVSGIYLSMHLTADDSVTFMRCD